MPRVGEGPRRSPRLSRAAIVAGESGPVRHAVEGARHGTRTAMARRRTGSPSPRRRTSASGSGARPGRRRQPRSESDSPCRRRGASVPGQHPAGDGRWRAGPVRQVAEGARRDPARRTGGTGAPARRIRCARSSPGRVGPGASRGRRRSAGMPIGTENVPLLSTENVPLRSGADRGEGGWIEWSSRRGRGRRTEWCQETPKFTQLGDTRSYAPGRLAERLKSRERESVGAGRTAPDRGSEGRGGKAARGAGAGWRGGPPEGVRGCFEAG